MITSFLKQSMFVLFLRLCIEKLQEALYCTKYIANGNRFKDWRKLKTDLSIRTHALEKGMSIGHVRKGFGKPKALSLLKDLQRFLDIGGDKAFVEESCSVIYKYILFNKELNSDMSDIESVFESFISRNHITRLSQGGLKQLDYKTIDLLRQSDFSHFSQSRFSVRDFGTEPIDIGTIKKALKMCERTPSACNRQSWRVYVFLDKELKSLLFHLQGGCRGFDSDMQCAILVCGDIRLYNINELHQVYVDGGLYAMNLMYALQYEGLANIPLTMGHKYKQIEKIKKQMNIPDNEVPILLIGVGSFKQHFKVAASERKDYSTYTIIK